MYNKTFLFFFRSDDVPRAPTRLRRSSGSSSRVSRGSVSSQEQNSVPAYIPAPAPVPVPPPAPAPAAPPAGVMPVELLVQQPGREHLPVLQQYPRRGQSTWLVFFLFVVLCFFPINYLANLYFFKRFTKSRNGISRCINQMMYSMLHYGYPKWSVIPQDERELWFRQFAV